MLLSLLLLQLLAASAAAAGDARMQVVVAAAQGCPHKLPLRLLKPWGALQVVQVKVPDGAVCQHLQGRRIAMTTAVQQRQSERCSVRATDT